MPTDATNHQIAVVSSPGKHILSDRHRFNVDDFASPARLTSDYVGDASLEAE